MCSELFRIPVEWSGIPIFGLGVLLAAWLIGGGVWLVILGRRQGGASEALSYLPGLLIGAVAIGGLPRLFPDGLPIRGYGVMVLSGSVAGLSLAAHRARQMKLNPELIFSMAFGMFLCGILGARLFYVIEYWQTRFQFETWSETLLATAKFTEGGLVVYGALIGGTIAFGWFVRRHHLPALAIADLIAPSLLVGLAFGRVGCLLNGCCYGGETEVPWAVSFPQESPAYIDQVGTGRYFGFRLAVNSDDPLPTIAEVEADSNAERAGLTVGEKLTSINGRQVQNVDEAQKAIVFASIDNMPLRLETATGTKFKLSPADLPARSRPVHPTQVYSAINAALLAWVLWSFFSFKRRDGEVIALMLTLYPISRFLLEMIRIDESGVFGTGLSISQNISVAIFLTTIGLWVYLRRQPPKRAAFSNIP